MTQRDFTSTDALLDAFLDHLHGRLDANDMQALERKLLADQGAAALCKDLAETIVLTQEAFLSEGAALKELKHVTGADLLVELARRESLAHAELINLSKPMPRKLSPAASNSSPLTFKQIASASAYLIRHSITPKVAATAGLAAALLLGVVLAIALLTGPTQTDPGLANTTKKPAKPTQPEPDRPALTDTVATLTAEYKAQWASASLAPGSTLRPGDRLTLTQGFAEITTKRGAIAILEAPATIELLDNDNALHLHSGKLVGICETEYSKGFLVHTPHLQVTDLGTRFGVDATQVDSTLVHVFDGEVEVATTAANVANDPIRLQTGQAAHSSPSLGSVVKTQSAPHAFSAIVPQAMPLPSTGAGLAIGQNDPAWSIVAIDGQLLDEPRQPSVFTDATHTSDASTPGGAQWLIWTKQGDAARKDVTYLFETRVSLPDDLDPAAASLNLRCAADNRLLAIIVNGQRVPVNIQTGIHDLQTIRVDRHLVPGQNSIGFEILDLGRSSAAVNYAGLQLAWQLETGGITKWERNKPDPSQP